MKFIANYKEFKNSVNESFQPVRGTNTKALYKAANIIAQFLNRKTRNEYRVIPMISFSGATPGVDMASGKDGSKIRVGGRDSNTPGSGLVASLSYFSSDDWNNAKITITSEQFPIVSLVNEFMLLISDPKYLRQAEESLVESLNEATKKALSPEEKKLVAKQLAGGIAATQISKSLGVPYSQILKIKRGQAIPETDGPEVKRNEQTLQDKVKFLEETLEDIFDISRKVAAGAFNSLMISGRAGTGKTFTVTKALDKEGLIQDEDYIIVSGAVSTVMMFKKLFQYRDKVLVFDDADAVFRDENGRNILKAALDTKKIRRISYLKKTKMVYDPKDYEDDPEGEYEAQENGKIPAYFDFMGRVIFISNLPKDKADPDGAIRSRSILIDVNPDDATLMERIKTLLPYLEPRDLPIEDKEEIYDFMKRAKDVSMRTFVKAAGFKMAGLNNWERMAKRYL